MTPGLGQGSPSAPIMLVGDAWGADEERTNEPFAGYAGRELQKMLHEAGIMWSECYATNVVNLRPPFNDITKWMPEKKKDISHIHVLLNGRHVHPYIKAGYDSLLREIELVNPRVIIALGGLPLWALGGVTNPLKWRGSLLPLPGERTLVPTIHPSGVMRQWENRVLVVNDFKRAKRQLTSPVPEPEWNFRLRPGLSEVLHTCNSLTVRMDAGEDLWLDLDIETVAGHIKCIGFSWSRLDAMCVPLAIHGLHGHYWSTPEEEGIAVYALYKLFTHPRAKIRWQNGLFDAQYVYRHWHYIPRGCQDTMLAHHALWAGMPKSLSFQASLYAEYYIYWKEMYKSATTKVGE